MTTTPPAATHDGSSTLGNPAHPSPENPNQHQEVPNASQSEPAAPDFRKPQARQYRADDETLTLDDSYAVPSVRAKNAIFGSTFTGTVHFGHDSKPDNQLLSLATEMQHLHSHYAPHACSAQAIASTGHTLVLVGEEGRGKRSCAIAIAQGRGYTHAWQSPPVMTTEVILTSLRAWREHHDNHSALIIHNVPNAVMQHLKRHPDLWRQCTTRTSGLLILTTRPDPATSEPESDFPALIVTNPPQHTILTTHGAHLLDDQRQAALAALAQLDDPTFDVVAAAITQAARGLTAEDIVTHIRGDAPGIEARAFWDKDLSARDVASALVGIVCTGSSVMLHHELTTQLERRILGPNPSPEPAPTFGTHHSSALPRFLQTHRKKLWTSFGPQPELVVQLTPEHDPCELLLAMWELMPPALTSPFLDWLVGVSSAREDAARSGAALVAGLLFITEPRLIEREVLRTWATTKSTLSSRIAALALGVPALRGVDTQAARTLVTTWLESGNDWRIRTAGFALGGQLGAWEPDSDAVNLLWELADNPDHRNFALERLAELATHDVGAPRVRIQTLALLKHYVKDESIPVLRTRELTAMGYTTCRITQILLLEDNSALRNAVLNGQEPTTYTYLSQLWSIILTHGPLHEFQEPLLRTFVYAHQQGKFSEIDFATAVRSMRETALPIGKEQLLADNIKATLEHIHFLDDDLRTLVPSILKNLFC